MIKNGVRMVPTEKGTLLQHDVNRTALLGTALDEWLDIFSCDIQKGPRDHLPDSVGILIICDSWHDCDISAEYV